MIVNGQHYRTLWIDSSSATVSLINQNRLPFKFEVIKSYTWQESCEAITAMAVRGAGALGAMAGFAMAQASLQAPANTRNQYLHMARAAIEKTRPTAHDLFFGVEKVYAAAMISHEEAMKYALLLAEENENNGRMIGIHGQNLIAEGSNILTHCNAGWLAFVDYGSALAPIYQAKAAGKKIHVLVSETRPRNQGARITAWELGEQGIDHHIIADNASAYYMQKGEVDMVITGADRIARNGDTANKIGTLEKAILAKEFGIPFYVAAPVTTFDANAADGTSFVIEHRSENEVLYTEGLTRRGKIQTMRLAAPGSKALNPAFDITPSKYITAFITPSGILRPQEAHSVIWNPHIN